MPHTIRGACFLVGAVLLGGSPAGPVAAQTRVNVTVNAGAPSGTLPDTAFGLNTSVGDSGLRDAALTPLLTQAGVGVLRFPGGSTADVYHWRTNTATAGAKADINPKDTFDAFMDVARGVHATPLLTVNYGTSADGTGGGTPQEAADWVTYANVTKHDGVPYWEIGDEVYGNGEYGSKWDTDRHADHSPADYGYNALKFINAMKGADPTIKVGVSLIAPGTWPDGVKPDWNGGVLSVCGSKIDFVSVHWCPQTPGHESDTGLLASTSQIPVVATRLRALITQYCGANAPNVQIFITKTAPVPYSPGGQTVSPVSALFLPDDYLTWLENGAANVDWWDLHTGPVTGKSGAGGYGDFGLFSTGASPEPAADTPFPAFYGLQMLAGLGRAGDRLVPVTSNRPLLSVHAIRRADDSLAVLLINKDPAHSLAAHVAVTGYKFGTTAAVYSYGHANAAITPSTAKVARTFTQTVPPYSLTVVVMTPPVKAAPKRAPKRSQPRPRPQSRPNYRPYNPRPRFRRYPGGVIYVVP